LFTIEHCSTLNKIRYPMPTKPMTPCRIRGCGMNPIAQTGYCEQHQILKEKQSRNKQNDRERGSASARGYDRRWRRMRKAYLNQNPLCVICLASGYIVSATVVDHIVPHRGDRGLFRNQKNWQALCKKCHDEKTSSEKNPRGGGAKSLEGGGCRPKIAGRSTRAQISK